jgi:hypothetical protein
VAGFLFEGRNHLLHGGANTAGRDQRDFRGASAIRSAHDKRDGSRRQQISHSFLPCRTDRPVAHWGHSKASSHGIEGRAGAEFARPLEGRGQDLERTSELHKEIIERERLERELLARSGSME